MSYLHTTGIGQNSVQKTYLFCTLMCNKLRKFSQILIPSARSSPVASQPTAARRGHSPRKKRTSSTWNGWPFENVPRKRTWERNDGGNRSVCNPRHGPCVLSARSDQF